MVQAKIKVLNDDTGYEDAALADDGSEYKIAFIKDGDTISEYCVDAEKFYDWLEHLETQTEMKKGGRKWK